MTFKNTISEKDNSQQPQERAIDSGKSCEVEKKTLNIGGNGELQSGSVEDYLPNSSPADTHIFGKSIDKLSRGCGKGKCGKNKRYREFYNHGDYGRVLGTFVERYLCPSCQAQLTKLQNLSKQEEDLINKRIEDIKEEKIRWELTDKSNIETGYFRNPEFGKQADARVFELEEIKKELSGL